DDQPLRLEGESNEVLEVPCHMHIQWHHVLGMNAHIRGEAEHPSLAIEALKTDKILDRVLLRNPHQPE
ncbi:MAG TPA: oxidoreductase, partial [Pseudomonas sp.]|nr:oxidoreductase [Pseudomonas sp.]